MHKIPTRRADAVIITKKKKKKKKKTNNKKNSTCRIVDFAILADHSMKNKESKKRDKYLDLARDLKKAMEHEGDGDTN